MQKPTIKVSVISDVVCPWCYIGKRRLEKAIHLLSNKFNFEVEYFPFELNPQMPASGLDQKEYLSDKFGGEEHYLQKTSHTTAIAEKEGLIFNFAAQKISPNTRTAHRLIQLAKEDNKDLAIVEALFKAYFTDGIDLSKAENLIQISVNAGLDELKVEQFLNSDTGISEVVAAENQLRQLGISGVPFYIVNNKYGISGAQPTEAFIEAFEEIGSTAPLVSETCDVDKQNC